MTAAGQEAKPSPAQNKPPASAKPAPRRPVTEAAKEGGSEQAKKAKPAEAKPDQADARAAVESFWPVDSIMQQATDNIGLRYNLDDVQRQKTRDMMNTRVTQFLDNHQDEIWPLIRELALHQRKGSVPDVDSAKRLGPVAMKILKEAQEEILRSNAEWREYLNEEQKRIHDYDLREMDKTFQAMAKNFSEWTDGRPATGNIFPQTEPAPDDPGVQRVAAAPTKVRPTPEPVTDVAALDAHMDAYVKRFITDYELTPPQVEAANSILREITERTAAFRVANEEALRDLRTKLQAERDVKARGELFARQRELTQPVNGLFSEMKDRLDQIPDEAQKDRFKAKSPAKPGAGGAISGTKGQRVPPAPKPAPEPAPSKAEVPADAPPPSTEPAKPETPDKKDGRQR